MAALVAIATHSASVDGNLADAAAVLLMELVRYGNKATQQTVLDFINESDKDGKVCAQPPPPPPPPQSSILCPAPSSASAAALSLAIPHGSPPPEAAGKKRARARVTAAPPPLGGLLSCAAQVLLYLKTRVETTAVLVEERQAALSGVGFEPLGAQLVAEYAWALRALALLQLLTEGHNRDMQVGRAALGRGVGGARRRE